MFVFSFLLLEVLISSFLCRVDLPRIHLRINFGIVEATILPVSFYEANLLLEEINHIISLCSSNDKPAVETIERSSNELEIKKCFDDIRNGSFQYVLMEGIMFIIIMDAKSYRFLFLLSN